VVERNRKGRKEGRRKRKKVRKRKGKGGKKGKGRKKERKKCSYIIGHGSHTKGRMHPGGIGKGKET
jgi:hypothetical protein